MHDAPAENESGSQPAPAPEAATPSDDTRPAQAPASLSAEVAALRKDAERKPLTAHFTPFYLMANARRIVPEIYNKRNANWVLAKDLFAVGSNSAIAICREANIDPDGHEVRPIDAARSGERKE